MSQDAPLQRVYLDAGTTQQLHPAARAALVAMQDEGWADPARLYREGRRARQLMDAAIAVFAETLNTQADSLVLYSSGTQAAHAAILGGLAVRQRVGATFVHSAIEHSAVLAAAAWHEKQSGKPSIPVAVDRMGL